MTTPIVPRQFFNFGVRASDMMKGSTIAIPAGRAPALRQL